MSYERRIFFTPKPLGGSPTVIRVYCPYQNRVNNHIYKNYILMKNSIEFQERIENKAITIVLVIMLAFSSVIAVGCSIFFFGK